MIASGYDVGTGMVMVYPSVSKAQPDLPISPQLGPGEVRVLLTWGSAPVDLDAHMTGPSGGGRFHVFYNDRGNASAAPFCTLDLDDRDGYGPETMTIKQKSPGVYRFSVHDYSNKDNGQSTALSQLSGAVVTVFDSSGLLGTFRVPQGQTGTIWRVFELDGQTGEVTGVNTFHFGASDDAGSFKAGADDELALFADLPPKR